MATVLRNRFQERVMFRRSARVAVFGAFVIAFCFACRLIPAFAGDPPRSSQSNVPRASSVIEPTAYVSLEPVPRGGPFEVAVVLKIRPGFHVNAHEASEDFLIPTAVSTEMPAGFRVSATNYPKGELRKFQFSQKKLNVYEGTVVVRLKIDALASAPLGTGRLALKVRYQACTNEICLPPVTLPVVAEVQVAERGSKSRPVHAEVFSSERRVGPGAKPRQPRVRQ